MTEEEKKLNQESKIPQKRGIGEVLEEYKKKQENSQDMASTGIPTASSYKPENFESTMNKETDPDLMTTYELIKLPSEGLFYENKIGEVEIEYMTSKDEDLITTPSLIDSGKVLHVLLKRKIKTKGVVVEDLLPGDRNALLLFLRSSSYGNEYNVRVYDPRNGNPFDAIVDLTKLEYKEVNEKPDQYGHFYVDLPMRKKRVVFRFLSIGEDEALFDKAQKIKEAYNQEFSEYNTMKLKAQIVSIEGNTDRSYIDRFVDAMPARDALTIRKKVLEVEPDVNMDYEFTAKDGYKFKSKLQIGVDFFFPDL